jgi:hypothetical protein
MKTRYTQIVLQHEHEEPAPDFSVVAVKDGVAIGCIYKMPNTDGNLPLVILPEFVTFISLFGEGVTFVSHAPVKEGTLWDGENFILPDTSGFESIGEIAPE